MPRRSAVHREWALAAWVRATRPATEAAPVALDGTTVRGAATATRAALHLVAFCTFTSQETLAHVPVRETTTEIRVA